MQGKGACRLRVVSGAWQVG